MREEVISSGTAEALMLGRSPPLTPAASSAGASSPALPTNVGSTDCLGSAQGSKAGSSGFPRLPHTSSMNAGSSVRASSHPSCRPWERADLLSRLATYRPSNWFGKPKGASSLDCARRGWVNIDIDRIECESCGASLNYKEMVSDGIDEEAFSSQLDAGHKSKCPWRGNSCADSLVQFPPTPPSALIGGYKDRCGGLLEFSTLPVIASSAIEKMRVSRGSHIDRLLSQSHMPSSLELGFKADTAAPGAEVSRDDPSSYDVAQKLISICGWEPRWLPNVQDCEEYSTQNPHSFAPIGDELHHNGSYKKNAPSSSGVKDHRKKEKFSNAMRFSSRSPLLDCSLCGATVNILKFYTVPRPAFFGPNNTDVQEEGKKMVLTRGVSAASGINGGAPTDGVEKERLEIRDEAGTADAGKTLSNAGVDLNLTMAGGLPPIQAGVPVISEHFNDGYMGRDLMICQPSGSEVGDRAASFESRGPSARKRNLEEGGSTVDRLPDRIQQADSVEGTVIDHDGDEVDCFITDSVGPSKRPRGMDIFEMYPTSCGVDSSGAGPSRTLCFDIDIDVNRVDSFREGCDVAAVFPSTRDSARASSVIAMDTICHSADEDSMESVENYPGDVDEVHFRSPNACKDDGLNNGLENNYSHRPQQSSCVQPPAAGSVARGMGISSNNEGEEIVNAETVSVHARDRISFGISGGSVGMGASHEAEVHGVHASIQRADSVVGDAEPMAEVIENLGQTGESAPGPGLMDEFIPDEIEREDAHGDSQDVVSRSLMRADSSSEIRGSTKTRYVEHEYKIGHDSSARPSLSCNAIIFSGYEASREEVSQKGKACMVDDYTPQESNYYPENATGNFNGEGDYVAEVKEFDPIKHHNFYCPWINENVAAAGCSSDSASSSSRSLSLSGWQLTLDALDTLHSVGHVPNQTMQSDSAASLYKDKHLKPNQKVLPHHSASKSHGRP